MENYKVYHIRINSKDIVNFCDASITPEFRRDLGDQYMTDKYSEVRARLRELYIQYFNEANGHFSNLEEEYIRDNFEFKNPILINSCKEPILRKISELSDEDKKLFSVTNLCVERLGGSRLYYAKKYGMYINCIVSDFIGKYEGKHEPLSEQDCCKYMFSNDKIVFNPEGAFVTNMEYLHIKDKTYDVRKQSLVRKEVIRKSLLTIKSEFPWIISNVI